MDKNEIAEKILKKFNNRIIFVDLSDDNKKVKCHCNLHDYTFEIRTDYIFKDKCKDACPYCHGTITNSEIINKKLDDRFGKGNIKIISKWDPFVNKVSTDVATFECKKHGNFEATVMYVFKYTYACPQCHKEGIIAARYAESIKKLKEITDPLDVTFNEKEFIGVNSPLNFYLNGNFLCKKNPGKILYSTAPKAILFGTESFGESFLKDYFDELNLIYEQQKTFSDLKYKNNLKYDFYIPKYNTLVEFDGSQHYNSNSKFYNPDQVVRDQLKDDYAAKNNFKILRIIKENNHRITQQESKLLKQLIPEFLNSSTTSKSIYIK